LFFGRTIVLKKTITYLDLDNNPVTEDFYFNLSKAELAEMQVVADGGLAGMLQEIIKSGDSQQILDHFKIIIKKAYGVRHEDGKQFIKSEELSQAFMNTNAYSELFVELMTSPMGAAEFITSIVPADIAMSAEDAIKLATDAMGEPAPDKPIAEMSKRELATMMQARVEEKKDEGLTRQALVEMPLDELEALMAARKAQLATEA
jgi:hypothetical protein